MEHFHSHKTSWVRSISLHFFSKDCLRTQLRGFSPSIPHSKGCFPRALDSPAVRAREITHLLTGSSIDTQTPASQEALPGLAHQFIHKSWHTHKHTRAQSITSALSRWSSVFQSEMRWLLTGYEKVRGQVRAWFYAGIRVGGFQIILGLQMYPLHLQLGLG